MSETQKHTKPNVPNLRFPGFSGEWKKSTVKNECIVNPKTEGLEKEFLYIDLESVVKGQLVKQNIISRDEAPSRAQRVLSKWDIIYQCVRPYQLNNYIIRDDSTIQRVASTGYAQIRTKHNPDFIYQLLHTKGFTDQVINCCTGTNYPAINSSDLSGIEIHFPSIQEQAQIGELLTLIDQRISIQSKVIEDLKKLKTAIEERIIKLVQGKQISLGDILEERNEKSTENNQFEVLSSTVTGIFNQREYFNKDIASANNSGYKIVRRGDIVLSPQNLWMGNINYNDCFEIGIVSPSYKVFSIRKAFDERYVSFLLKTKKALWEYSLVSEQGASIVRRNLNLESFLEISFPIPSYITQKEIGEMISAVNSKLLLEQKLLNSLSRQKSYLLNSMFI